MKNLFLILTLPLFLISCIEVRDANKETKSPAATAQPVAEVTALSQPQRYSVLIKGISSMSQITRKPVSLFTENQLSQAVVLKSDAEDVIDQPGLYEYSVQQAGHTFLLQVEIPRDYVVEGNMKLDQLDTNIKREEDHFRILETKGRVYFKAGSSLTTDGENFLIRASSIESEGAFLQTFPEHLEAAKGSHGRHGGHVMLEAQSIRGTLQVFMRGESGGDGESTTFLTNKKLEQLNNNGGNGGNSGLLEVVIPDQSRGQVTFTLEPGQRGQGVPIIVSCFLKNCGARVYKPKGQDGFDGIAEQPIGL